MTWPWSKSKPDPTRELRGGWTQRPRCHCGSYRQNTLSHICPACGCEGRYELETGRWVFKGDGVGAKQRWEVKPPGCQMLADW